MITHHRVWVYGDHINTDVIFPGKYTYNLRTQSEIASKALEDHDPTFATSAQTGDIIVAGRNWGCGSSREQAVTALKYNGIVAIIAESFNGLYYRNCINQGIEPIICMNINAVLQTGDIMTVDRLQNIIMANGHTYDLPPLSDSVRAIINAGGLVPLLQQRFVGVTTT